MIERPPDEQEIDFARRRLKSRGSPLRCGGLLSRLDALLELGEFFGREIGRRLRRRGRLTASSTAASSPARVGGRFYRIESSEAGRQPFEDFIKSGRDQVLAGGDRDANFAGLAFQVVRFDMPHAEQFSIEPEGHIGAAHTGASAVAGGAEDVFAVSREMIVDVEGAAQAEACFVIICSGFRLHSPAPRRLEAFARGL